MLPGWNYSQTCNDKMGQRNSGMQKLVEEYYDDDLEQGDMPTLMDLMEMKAVTGEPLRVIETIAAGNYKKLGMYLLRDKNGRMIDLIEKNHIVKGAESVTQAILSKWLTSDASTRTYQHLIECLRQSDLGALAELIENTIGQSKKTNQLTNEKIAFQSLIHHSTLQQDTVVQTMNLQGSNPLALYASYLKELYSSMSHSHTSQHWTHLPRSGFVKLAMIKDDEEVRRGGPEEKIVRLAQQGKIQTILNHTTPIDLEKLFLIQQPLVALPPPPNTRVTLIECAPGGGKSTLALHICHQWAQAVSWLERFDLVVLAYLRDQAIQEATTLTDILPANSLQKPQVVATCTYIQESNGHNVLFIFDGWDEFPSHLQTNSFVSTIIREPHKLSLHLSTVLITSRPVSSGNLLHIADQRVEILGFTQHQIREYIDKALSGKTTRIQKLVQHLEEHPVIEGYCYVPLHVAILVHIFLIMKEALPTTLHELFSSLVLCCIVREQATHEPDTSLPELSSLDDLPDNLKNKLSDLCILAYEGVMQDKVVYYHDDLHKFNLPNNLPSLGLLHGVEGLTLLSKSLSYNFLHLSVQELLAAYHISHMDSSKQLEVFKHMFGGSRFQAVLHHYSGFSKLANPAIRGFISTYSQQIQNFSDLMPLLHCFYEAQDLSLCSLVRSGFTTNVVEIDFQKVNPVDYLAVGYFVTFLLSETFCGGATNIYLKIKDTVFDSQKFKFLLLELVKMCTRIESSSGIGRTKTLELELSGMKITLKVAELIISYLKKLSVWSKLIIKDCGISSDGLTYITNELQKTDYSHLIELHFVNTIINNYDYSIHIIGSNFKELLERNKTLKHLCQSGSPIAKPRYIFQGLEHNTTLIRLSLNNFELNDAALAALTKMLQINKTLTHLDISGNDVLLEKCNIFKILQHNTTLVYLNLSNTKINDVALATLGKMLEINRTLTHLDLSGNLIENWNFLQAFQDNTTLFHLNISNTGLIATEDAVQALTNMLEINKTLTELDLSDNFKFLKTSEGVDCMCEGLQNNTTLVYLNLSHTGLSDLTTDDAVQVLTIMLQLKTLTHLDLSENWTFLTSELVVNCMCKGLQHNTTLHSLKLKNTGYTDKAKNQILQATNYNLTLDISLDEPHWKSRPN